MSYLNATRLHFAGQFQANISTVNNDPAHFYSKIFEPSWWQVKSTSAPNGWFNPQGDADFRLLGCKVTSAWTAAGAAAADDPVLTFIVADTDRAVPAKLVDLDPEQQMASEIWGLEVRIADGDGNTLVRGQFAPAGFTDIWTRATESDHSSDAAYGATYQSVLQDVEWGDVSGSAFLSALRSAASGGPLSIKFNVDGINMGDPTAADWLCGRIVGTIGPAAATDPQMMLIARQFMSDGGAINFFPAVVDENAGLIYLDLGNALPTSTPGSPLSNLGNLTLGLYDPIATPGNPAGSFISLGVVPASDYALDQDWYARTAGVAVLPLTAEQLQAIAASPLTLVSANGDSISEAPSGAFVRADKFVYRLSPGDSIQIPIYAAQWGKPLANAQIAFAIDNSQLQPTPDQYPYLMASPPVGTPASALGFASPAITDANGKAMLAVTAGDPGTPRWFNNGSDYGIDGQVYGLRPAFADPELQQGPIDEANFISFLIWSGFTPANPVTWADVGPILVQYGQLYPVMQRFLDLTSYDDVVANAGPLVRVFGLDPSDPNSMPVTRDLSPAKRAAILSWLADPRPAPPGAAVAAGHRRRPPPASKAAPSAAKSMGAPIGGKAAALARRLIVQQRQEQGR